MADAPPPPIPTWWETHPEAAKFENQVSPNKLEESSKKISEVLFSLLDKTGDGKLSAEDFEVSNPEAQHNFTAFHHELDANGDHEITPEEFVAGLKKKAMMRPVNKNLFTATSADTHLKFLMATNSSLNEAYRAVAKEMLESLLIFDDPTKTSLSKAWDSLDVDGDGSITAKDFVGDPHAEAKWKIVSDILDKDGDGSITKDE